MTRDLDERNLIAALRRECPAGVDLHALIAAVFPGWPWRRLWTLYALDPPSFYRLLRAHNPAS